MSYIADKFYDGLYLILGLYRQIQGGAPPPPVEKTYFVLEVPNSNNPIDKEGSGSKKVNTIWKDTELWDDSEYWFDEWYIAE